MPVVTEATARTRSSAHRPVRRGVSPILVGRRRERAELVEALAARPAIVAIEGEAGVGKTRLVRDVAADLRDQVLVGHCLPLREPLLLGPVIEAVEGAILPRLEHPLLGALRSFLPELGERLPPALPPLTDRGSERHRVFRAMRALLGAAGDTTLVIEDLQWAETATLDFVRFLVASQPRSLNVVLTYRPEQKAVSGLLAQSPQRRPPITLTPLSLEGVREQASAILGMGEMSDEFAAFLHRKTSGIPFVTEEVLSLLVERGAAVQERGRWICRTADTMDVPPAVRDAVLERLAAAPPEAIRVARATAVLHVPSTERAIARTAGVNDLRSRRGLAWCLDAQLLEERPTGVFAFRHELARDAIHGSLSWIERRELNARAARFLEASGGEHAARVAFHLREAGRHPAAARWGLRAARIAIERSDDAAAAAILQASLALTGVPKADRIEIATLLGETALHGLSHADAMPAVTEVLASRSLPPGARGEIMLALGLLTIQAGDATSGFAKIREAVPSLRRRPRSAARAMGTLGSPWRVDADEAGCRRWLDKAVQRARAQEDRSVTTAVLVDRASFLACFGPPDVTEAVAAVPWDASTVAERRQLVRCCLNLAQAAVHRGSLDEAECWYREGVTRSEDLGYDRQSGALQTTRLLLDWMSGTWDGLAQRAERLAADHARVPHVAVDAQLVGGLLALAQADHDRAMSRLTDVAERARRSGAIPAMAAARAGLLRLQSEGAASALDDAHVDLEIVARSGNWAWAPELAWQAVATCIAARRIDRARQLVARIEAAIADRHAPAADAALAVCRGLVLSADGARADAARSLATARRRFTAASTPYREALAWEQLGNALDGGRRRDALRSSVELFEALGAGGDAARVRVALGIPGERGSPVWRGGRRGYGTSLSPREREVASLVTRGLRNQQIADELFLSPRTVEAHVSRAMRKLGAATRTALAVAMMGDEAAGD